MKFKIWLLCFVQLQNTKPFVNKFVQVDKIMKIFWKNKHTESDTRHKICVQFLNYNTVCTKTI